MSTFSFKTITTDRLQLRELNPEVYMHVFRFYNDAELRDFFGFASNEELDKEKKNYQAGLTTFNKSFLFFQLLEKQSRLLLGHCGYHTWFLPHNRAELFYWINEEGQRGRGYMKEALPPVLRYGFEEMKLNRIEALAGTDNAVSLGLLARFGFKKEGTLRDHYINNGKVEDSVLFSLLKKEFITPDQR